MNLVFEKILANLFFLFFIAQILSPYVAEKTIYLEVFIALLNPYFLIWLKQQTIVQMHIWFIIGLGILLLFLQILLVVKVIFILISVLFLFYAFERKVFYIKGYLMISIVIASLQFIFIFINPEISNMLGPENISKTFWGAYATPSFTNFYTVFLIPRVSGLSREAGFFASLLGVVIFMYYLESHFTKNYVQNRVRNSFLWVGYILSFSKMSLMIFPLVFIQKIKYIIDKIPFIFIPIVFTLFFMFFWQENDAFLLNPVNDSFLHRFSGYVTLFSINLKQLFFGINIPTEIDSIFARYLYHSFDNFAGFSGFILDKGLIVTFIFLGTLWITGISSSGILILLLLTINVQIDTNQNFVVLAYFIIYKYFRTIDYTLRSLDNVSN